jgi:large subunit ribosomal protein L19
MNLLQTVESELLAARERQSVDVRPGDTVRVHVRITEGEKTRIQVFEGTVIRIRKGGLRTTFTVRKISSGVGVERIFPASSPNIQTIEITARHKVRRAKLYYLRSRRGKSARLKPVMDFKRATSAVQDLDAPKKRSKKRGRKNRAPQA